MCNAPAMESVKKWLSERAVKKNGLYVHYSPPKSVGGVSGAQLRQWARVRAGGRLEKAVLAGQGGKLRVAAGALPVPNRLSILAAHCAALHSAVKRGSLAELQVLLELLESDFNKSKLVMCTDEAGVSLLHKAIYYDYMDIAEWLVRHYPQLVHMKDSEGRTALHYVAMCKDEASAASLLEGAGAVTGARDAAGRLPSYYRGASRNQLVLPAIVDMPKENSNSPSGLVIKRSNIRIWFHDCDMGRLQRIVWEGHGAKLLSEVSNQPVVKRFLEAVPYMMNTIREIHAAVVRNDIEGVMKHSGDPVPPIALSSRDVNNLTVFHKAAGLGHGGILKYLAERYPQGVNDVDNDGKTPLHYAACVRDEQHMFNTLIGLGADESIVDNKNKSPAYYINRPQEIDKTILKIVPDAPRTASSAYPSTWDWKLLDTGIIADLNKKSRRRNKPSTDNSSSNNTSENTYRQHETMKTSSTQELIKDLPELDESSEMKKITSNKIKKPKKEAPVFNTKESEKNDEIAEREEEEQNHANDETVSNEENETKTEEHSEQDNEKDAEDTSLNKDVQDDTLDENIDRSNNDEHVDNNEVVDNETTKYSENKDNEIGSDELQNDSHEEHNIDMDSNTNDEVVTNDKTNEQKLPSAYETEETKTDFIENNLDEPTEDKENKVNEPVDDELKDDEVEKSQLETEDIGSEGNRNKNVSEDDDDVQIPGESQSVYSEINLKSTAEATDSTSATRGNQTNGRSTQESLIEGIVNGDIELDSQDASISQREGSIPGDVLYVDNEIDPEVTELINTANMEMLAALVLNGEGARLVGRSSGNLELQAFLDNVPIYMKKIHKVHISAREGNIRDLQAALDRRKFAIARDPISPNGATPLHVATIFGKTNIIKYLGGRFPETLSAVDFEGRTALHYAAVLPDNGHYYNLLQQLGSNSKDLDDNGRSAEEYYRNTSLMSLEQMLTDFGITEEAMQDMLSDKGTSHTTNGNMDIPMFRTEEGRYLAKSLGDPLIKGLTEVANVKPKDPIAFLASFLHNFPEKERPRLGTQESNLLVTQELPEVENEQSAPVVRTTQTATIKKPDRPIDVITIDPKPEPSPDAPEAAFSSINRDEHGQSMLHFAAARTHTRNALFQLLQESDVNLAYRDELYRTARDVSIQANVPENTNEIDRWVLQLAARDNSEKIMDLLLEGYDHILDVLDEEGVPIAEVISQRGLVNMTNLLESIPAFEDSREALHAAVRQGDLATIQEALSAEGGRTLARGKNTYGRTALHIAVLAQHEDVVAYLSETSPELLRIGDNLERTPLHYAMGVEKIESLSRVLIKSGAKRVLKDLKGRQPSYYFMNKSDILRLKEEEEGY